MNFPFFHFFKFISSVIRKQLKFFPESDALCKAVLIAWGQQANVKCRSWNQAPSLDKKRHHFTTCPLRGEAGFHLYVKILNFHILRFHKIMPVRTQQNSNKSTSNFDKIHYLSFYFFGKCHFKNKNAEFNLQTINLKDIVTEFV